MKTNRGCTTWLSQVGRKVDFSFASTCNDQLRPLNDWNDCEHIYNAPIPEAVAILPSHGQIVDRSGHITLTPKPALNLPAKELGFESRKTALLKRTDNLPVKLAPTAPGSIPVTYAVPPRKKSDFPSQVPDFIVVHRS